MFRWVSNTAIIWCWTFIFQLTVLQEDVSHSFEFIVFKNFKFGEVYKLLSIIVKLPTVITRPWLTVLSQQFNKREPTMGRCPHMAIWAHHEPRLSWDKRSLMVFAFAAFRFFFDIVIFYLRKVSPRVLDVQWRRADGDACVPICLQVLPGTTIDVFFPSPQRDNQSENSYHCIYTTNFHALWKHKSAQCYTVHVYKIV